MIVAEGISMIYRRMLKRVLALQDISFEVGKGEIFGIVGPDGAGKTSLFRILTTLLLPTCGKARVGGYDIIEDFREVRHIVGYMPGKFSLYQDLSVEENLQFFARVFDTTVQANYGQIKDIYEQLAPFKTRKAGALSGGMKQKLGLCCALIHKPKVLFLDEPTTGVDPISRKEFWDVLRRLSGEGMSILVSTPYMDEAVLCDRIGLIFDGEILATDTPQALIRRYDKKLIAFRGENMYALLKAIRRERGVYSCFTFGDVLHVAFEERDYGVEQLVERLVASGHKGLEWKPIPAGIEDYFMKLTKDKTHGDGHRGK